MPDTPSRTDTPSLFDRSDLNETPDRSVLTDDKPAGGPSGKPSTESAADPAGDSGDEQSVELYQVWKGPLNVDDGPPVIIVTRTTEEHRILTEYYIFFLQNRSIARGEADLSIQKLHHSDANESVVSMARVMFRIAFESARNRLYEMASEEDFQITMADNTFKEYLLSKEGGRRKIKTIRDRTSCDLLASARGLDTANPDLLSHISFAHRSLMYEGT